MELLVTAVALILLAVASCSLVPRPGDPARLPSDDPRVAQCGISKGDMWMAFSMAKARDFTEHFPGWSQGAEELLVDDSALVIIGNGFETGFAPGLAYNMCIAIGAPGDALIHHYDDVRFDAVRPDLGQPAVPMP